MLDGNSGDGKLVSTSRNSGCTLRECTSSSNRCSSVGIHDPNRWQFMNTTHEPSSTPARIVRVATPP